MKKIKPWNPKVICTFNTELWIKNGYYVTVTLTFDPRSPISIGFNCPPPPPVPPPMKWRGEYGEGGKKIEISGRATIPHPLRFRRLWRRFSFSSTRTARASEPPMNHNYAVFRSTMAQESGGTNYKVCWKIHNNRHSTEK